MTEEKDDVVQEETTDETLTIEENEDVVVEGEANNDEEKADGEEAPESSEDELIISIDGEEQEEEHKPDPSVIKNLRKANRKHLKRIKELERQHKASTENKPVDVGPKPTIAGCDYDQSRYEKEYGEWIIRKQQADARAATVRQAQENQQKEYADKLARYNESKAELKVRDYDEAEDNVREILSEEQQSYLIQGSSKPELIIYAIGKNIKKAQELAAIKDPVKFIWEVARLETKVSTAKSKKAPKPEGSVPGSGGISKDTDARLKQLEEEADRTGNRTKVAKYRREMRKQK